MDHEQLKLRASVMLDSEIRDEWSRCQAARRPRPVDEEPSESPRAESASVKIGILEVEANSRGINLTGRGTSNPRT